MGVPSIKRDESPAVIRGILERINVRNIGSTAAHLALLSAGAIDAVYCRRCYAWDIAAGCLLIAEAGGVCTGPDGRPCLPLPPRPDPTCTTPVLACGPEAHAQLLDMLNGSGPAA